MARTLPLLDDESVVCIGPGDMIITSDGWIAEKREHRHEGITQLFRLLKISSIEKKEWTDSSPRAASRAILFCSMIVGMGCCIFLPFSEGLSIFSHGYDVSTCVDLDGGGFSCSPIPDTLLGHQLTDYIANIAISLLLLILVLGMLPHGRSLVLHHSRGKMEIPQEPMTELFVYYFLSWMWYIFAAPTPGGGMYEHFDTVGVFIGILLFLFFARLKQQYFPEKNGQGGPSDIPKFNLVEFHNELNNQIGDEEGKAVFSTVSMRQRMPEETRELYSRIEAHENDLSRISSDWTDIFTAPSPKLGIQAIRRETEVVLYNRVLGLPDPPNLKKPNLVNLRQTLTRHDPHLRKEQLDVETISALGNKASHVGRPLTPENYISTLQAFTDICEWHFSNPTPG